MCINVKCAHVDCVYVFTAEPVQPSSEQITNTSKVFHPAYCSNLL